MKTFKFFLVLSALVAGISLFACSDDKDDENGDEDNGKIENVKTGWSEDGNKAYFKFTQKTGGYTLTHVYTFTFTDNDICTKASYSIDCGSSAIASAIWEAMNSEDRKGCKLSGSKIICEDDLEYAEMTKEDVKSMMKILAEQLKG